METPAKRKKAGSTLPRGCMLCRGAPHVTDGNGQAARCSCVRGRILAKIDMQRSLRQQPATRGGSG